MRGGGGKKRGGGRMVNFVCVVVFCLKKSVAGVAVVQLRTSGAMNPIVPANPTCHTTNQNIFLFNFLYPYLYKE